MDVYQVATAWLVLMAWPMYLGLAIFAPLLLRVFKPQYVSGASSLEILAVTMLVATGIGPVDMVLLMGGRSFWNLFNVIVALTVNVGLSLLLIPHCVVREHPHQQRRPAGRGAGVPEGAPVRSRLPGRERQRAALLRRARHCAAADRRRDIAGAHRLRRRRLGGVRLAPVAVPRPGRARASRRLAASPAAGRRGGYGLTPSAALS
jgi:hypothetical protein